MGELLTVTALGGACFGLPTTMVSERERGVWRRYRLAPVRTGTLIASTVVARYVLLLVAGALQVALAMGIGMPLPNHPFDLWVAFTFVAFALLGLGLVIATLADNVPAVQALGQCIFLPMLIIGGVAVQLASLPSWAQHLSAFFPGRYAVASMQACVTGDGLGAIRFSLLALLLIGAAGCLAGVKMFRWDAEQRFAARGGKAWVAVALSAWAAVGLIAEARGQIAAGEAVTQARAVAPPAQPPLEPATTAAPAPAPATPPAPAPPPGGAPPAPPAREDRARTDKATAPATAAGPVEKKPEPAAKQPAASPGPSTAARTAEPPPARGAGAGTAPSNAGGDLLPEPASWQQVTPAHIDQVVFSRLPSDAGVVSPIAPLDEVLEPDVEAEVEEVRNRLVTWGPGQVQDPVQRVRNVLYVAAVPDVFQMPTERYLPHVVFERLEADIPKEDLIKILFWVATHPMGGDDSAVDQLRAAGLDVSGPGDIEQTRERVMLYALKLLGRLTGKIPA
jgi:hypothetical protein